MRTVHGNIIRFSSLCLLGVAASVAGSAHGQEMVFEQTPNATVGKMSLSVDGCSLAAQGFEPGQPYGPLLQPLPAACQSVLGQELQDRVGSNPSQVQPMYGPDPAPWPENLASTTADNLGEGLVDAFVENDLRVQHNSALTYHSTMLPAQGSPLLSSMAAPNAIAHHAHPDWEARGSNIGDASNPCGEWVWKGFFDYSRYEDAARACGTNDECIYQVAYSSDHAAPGIAHRSHLHGIDGGNYFPLVYSIPLIQGFVSKNPFFGTASAFLFDQQAGLLDDLDRFHTLVGVIPAGRVDLQAGPKKYACATNFRFRNPESKYYVDPTADDAHTKLAALDQDIEAVRALLQMKAGYLIDPTPLQSYTFRGAERFDDEWDYHEAMHDRQKPLHGQMGQPLPRAERQAIEERTQTLLDLIDKYTRLTSAMVFKEPEEFSSAVSMDPVGEALDRIVNPMPDDDRVVNPVVRRAAVSTMSRDLVPSARTRMLETDGAAVTNHMAVPFRMSTDSPAATDADVPVAPQRANTTLTGAERDYGKATMVEKADTGYTASCPTPPQETLQTESMYDLARAAQEVQEQIVALLIDEYKRGPGGCLSPDGYNCDWSPAMFAQRFEGHFAKSRENAFQYCVLMTGGNTLDNPDQSFHVPKESRNMDEFPVHLQSVKDLLREQLDGLPYMTADGGEAQVGERVTGGQDIGDASWFGAGYDYTAGWSVTPDFGANPTDNTAACGLGGSSDATFNAHVSVLGQHVPLVHVQGQGQAADGTGSYGIEAEFLGQTFENSGGMHFHQVDTGSVRTNKASATVVVVVVPVTFEVFGEMEFGYDVEAEATSQSTCGTGQSNPRLGMKLSVQPFARVNAVGSAGVGVSGAQAGVRGRIALLDTKLPLDASLYVKPDPEIPSSIKLFPTASADFEAATLSGRMSAFAEVDYKLGSYTAEKTIYSWRGLHDSVPLWQLDSDPVQLAAFHKRAWDDWRDINRSHISSE